MAYSPTYQSSDLDDIAVDGIGTAGVTFIGYIVIIILVLLTIWLDYRLKRGK